MKKWFYYFGYSVVDENAHMSDILGNKGSGLAEMSRLGLPVPYGFTISTALCEYFFTNNQKLPDNFSDLLRREIMRLEKYTGKVFGGYKNPLLLSVRSGSNVSMPGMMDTILNLGINDQTMESLALLTKNRFFALDTYRRFLESFGSSVFSIPNQLFKKISQSCSEIDTNNMYHEIPIQNLEQIILEFKKIISKHTRYNFSDPYVQLENSIKAILKSWFSERAVLYRKFNNISDNHGTAINIQTMVFGNLDNDSGTGVVFTRNPSTGDNKLFGEYLINSQGEDLVSGRRTPEDLSFMKLKMPQLFLALESICKSLESHYLDIQDIEFTVEQNKLFILQTRSAKRSAIANIKILVEMVNSGFLSKDQALMRIDPESLKQLLHNNIDTTIDPITVGLPASPGAISGMVSFSTLEAEKMSLHSNVILVRRDTSPEDIHGLHIASGVLTTRGGMTSHAAVIARGIGKPCVCGANKIIIDSNNLFFTIDDIVVRSGDIITIDGSSGKVFLGKMNLIQPKSFEEFNTILNWSDEIATLKIRANAETELDAKVALDFGASGIGLCRTEHMFFDNKKISMIQEMIIAPDFKLKEKAISRLLPLQIEDFKSLFKIIRNKPINIRLLDPPLHEFLPTSELEILKLSESMSVPIDVIKERIISLHEINPMLGHRGCRIGISCPEIYQMQINAILSAIIELNLEEKINTNLELMIPFVCDVKEVQIIKSYIFLKIKELEKVHNIKFNISFGVMIELPRAILQAKKIASEVNYFSFGTNDLTQTTYGISRDDMVSFFADYIKEGIFLYDPFSILDQETVGELVITAIKNALEVNKVIKFGACGEHSGDPKSIEFFYKIGLNYVSCSPYRIPIARLAAAQAKIKDKLLKK